MFSVRASEDLPVVTVMEYRDQVTLPSLDDPVYYYC